jgi:hypothetical protein
VVILSSVFEAVAVGPEAEPRVGDIENLFAVDGVEAVDKFGGVVVAEHDAEGSIVEACAFDFFSREMAGAPDDFEAAFR